MAERTPVASRTAALLVVYRARQPLGPLLQHLAACVGHVVLVDNAEQPDPALPALAQAQGVTLIAAGNRGALAGAYNRALELLRTRHAGRFDQVLLLDDDSDPHVIGPFLADPDVAARLADADTAAIAPAYRDRATGLRGRCIDLGRWRLRYFEREFSDLRQVAFVINSMSVWRLAAVQRIGRFDEDLALDHVDTDYCLRARRDGLAVWVHGAHEFAHSIGARRRFRFLGREMQAGGHGPERRYLIARNTVRLLRRWLWREPAFAFLCLTRLAYEAVGIVVAEERAATKLLALLRGTLAGLFGLRRA